MQKTHSDRTLLYKYELLFLKFIPMILAATAVLNTTLSYYGIEAPILSYLGGVSIFSLAFLYLSSYVFRFCEYHRMFLHYILVNWILNIVDYYIGIPLSDRNLFLMYVIIAGLFLFLVLYFHQKSVKARRLE